jgi:hypothetical protein
MLSEFDSLVRSLTAVIQVHRINVSEMPCSRSNSLLRLTFMCVRMNLHSVFRCMCKTAKKTISFVMSVQLSVRLSARMEQLSSHWMDFHEICYLGNFFENLSRKFKIL